MKKKRLQIVYLLLIATFAVVSVLLAVALIFFPLDEQIGVIVSSSQIMPFLLVFLLALPLLLFAFLTVVFLRERARKQVTSKPSYLPKEVHSREESFHSLATPHDLNIQKECQQPTAQIQQPQIVYAAQPYLSPQNSESAEQLRTGEKKGGREIRNEEEEVEAKEEAERSEENRIESRSRFYMLCKLDKEQEKYQREEYDEQITLKEICERFRNFAASRLKLYYDIADIRRFISGLSVSQIMILQGISGTGKTSLGYAFGEFLDNQASVVPVQPMWKERTDLIGYYNEFTKKFNETTLLQKIYEANYSQDMYITILDEMNIARIEYYFAEFLSLLEIPKESGRYLDVVSDEWENDPTQLVGGKVRLSPNMWFIGTANNDDSTFSISDKVYDRAMVINLDNKAEAFYAPKTEPIHLRAERFRKLAEEARIEYELSKRNERRLEKLAELIQKHFRIGFGNRIRKQITTYIPVYLASGGDELEALDDIMAKKVMRKLEMQNTVYIKNSAEAFCCELEELFGRDKMKQCKDYVTMLAGKR